jgi:hypothetical protein
MTPKCALQSMQHFAIVSHLPLDPLSKAKCDLVPLAVSHLARVLDQLVPSPNVTLRATWCNRDVMWCYGDATWCYDDVAGAMALRLGAGDATWC